MSRGAQFSRRLSSRVVAGALAVVIFCVAVWCWWAAQSTELVESPARDGVMVEDRFWDTRWLAAAVLAADLALVAGVYAAVPRPSR